MNTTEPVQTRPWYKKKRYLIPLGLIGVLAVAGASSNPTPAAVQINKTAQVESQQISGGAIQTTEIVSPTAIPVPVGDSTYKNRDGNTVPSPVIAPSAPEGATAQCRDGTYSFSQNRSGTCSHHGGVSRWF